MFKNYNNQDTTKDFVHAHSWIIETSEFVFFMEKLVINLGPFMQQVSFFAIPSVFGTEFMNIAVQCSKTYLEDVRFLTENLTW